MEFKCVSNEQNLIEIKKSKFYTYLFAVFNEDQVKEKLTEIKKEHKDASHICYGYVISSPTIQKCSDAGEPSGTAGLPILNVIKNQHLTNVLIAVVRYFGGIKLGVGGLTRAYSNSAVEVLKKTEFNVYNEYECFLVKTDFSNKKLIDKLMHNYTLFGVDFSEINDGKIAYNFGVKDENSNISEIKNHCDCEIISLGKKMIAEGKNGKNNKD